MTRPRSPETQERREWLKQLRKDCNSIYKRLQKLPPNCKTGKKHLLYSYKSAIKQLNERWIR